MENIGVREDIEATAAHAHPVTGAQDLRSHLARSARADCRDGDCRGH